MIEPVAEVSLPVPSALPTAVTASPTATADEAAVSIVFRFDAPAAWSTATSSATSYPTTLAVYV